MCRLSLFRLFKLHPYIMIQILFSRTILQWVLHQLLGVELYQIRVPKQLNLDIQAPHLKERNEAASCYYNRRRSHGRRGRISFSQPTRFTEDFDFVAMNEKFNKAEVWGHLSKGKALVEYDKRKEQSSYMNAIREEDEESVNLESQPAYSKDDFFDKLSDKLEPGTDSGRASVSEQLKVDMETPPRHRSKRRGRWGFRGGNGGRWHGSNYDRGNSSNTRGRGHGFPD